MSARVVARQWALRSAALGLWTLALWGALLLLLLLLDVAAEGPRPALARLLPPPGASVWAWINALSVALAAAVAIVAGGLLVGARRDRRQKG